MFMTPTLAAFLRSFSHLEDCGVPITPLLGSGQPLCLWSSLLHSSALLGVCSALRGADIDIVSDKSGQTILLVPSRIQSVLFGMCLKKLWRQIQFLKGERGFSKISVNGLL